MFSTPLAAAFTAWCLASIGRADCSARHRRSHEEPPRHVVVLQEDDAPSHGLVGGEMDDMADDLLAAGVLGMGFAGKDELDRRSDRSQLARRLASRRSRSPVCRRRSAGQHDRQLMGSSTSSAAARHGHRPRRCIMGISRLRANTISRSLQR